MQFLNKIITLFFLFSSQAWGYAQFIGSGEASCINCHFNAFGSSQLTDYGRSTFAVDITSPHFRSSELPKDVIAQRSTFFAQDLPSWFRPHAKYRGLRYTRNAWKRDSYTRYNTTEAQVGLALKAGNNNNFILSYTGGYHPSESQEEGRNGNDLADFVNKEYYLSLAPVSSLRIYAGLMDKVFGLRIPDYTAFSRSTNSLGSDDQVHQVSLWANFLIFEGGLSFFSGNLHRDPDLRDQGASLMLELTPWVQIRPGLSLMTQHNSKVAETLLSTHFRIPFDEGAAILLETGVKNQKSRIETTAPALTGIYGFFQGFIPLTSGLNLLHTIEFYTRDYTTHATNQFRFGPGLQYFLLGRAEMRVDFINHKNYLYEYVERDGWELLMHLSFWL